MEPNRDQAARFLTARWTNLAMLNYEVDPRVLTPLVPEGTALDAWEGRYFVSMVGFRFLDTRVLGVPIPLYRDFEEINLRFYVRREGPPAPRRGVVFVKEIVPRRAIAWVARALYNENYVALPTRHKTELVQSKRPSVTYEWRTGDRWNRLSVDVAGEAELVDEASEESFITEHYWGYVPRRSGGTLEYQVEHPRWRVWRTVGAELDCDVEQLYGPDFVDALAGEPSSAFLAEGSRVTVRRGRAVE